MQLDAWWIDLCHQHGQQRWIDLSFDHMLFALAGVSEESLNDWLVNTAKGRDFFANATDPFACFCQLARGMSDDRIAITADMLMGSCRFLRHSLKALLPRVGLGKMRRQLHQLGHFWPLMLNRLQALGEKTGVWQEMQTLLPLLRS